MISSPIVPAFIPKSQVDLEDFVSVISSLPEVHLDVVDGQFVPYSSWPYEPVGTPDSVARLLASFALEVDLMVVDPLSAATAWIKAGADRLIFHIETISVEALRQFATTTKVTIGVSANNDTDIKVLEAYLPYAEYVQVMGIATIGAQGLPFDERAYTRIEELRALAPHLSVGIDGSVNATTLPKLATYQLDRYIVGSAITRAPDMLAAYKELTLITRSK